MNFIINEHDVCINPITEELYRKGFVKASISYAEHDGKWASAVDWMQHNAGGVEGRCRPKL